MVAKMQAAAEPSDFCQRVVNEIQQKPELSETDVSVTAHQGVVTLSGSVKTEAERIAVETAAKQVRGVRAVANDLDVKPSRERSNTEIARAVLKALRDHIFLTAEDIQVIVRDGCVKLEGNVHQELQKLLAESEVKRQRGIFGITNLLEVKPEATSKIDIGTVDIGALGSSNNSAWVETGEAEAG